jgi:hypothetical protein
MAEAPKMAQYYGNAFITLAADCAVGDTEGFLNVRPTKGEGSVNSARHTIYADEVKSFQHQDDRGTLSLHLKNIGMVGRPSSANPVEDEPLQHRAWTLQERYLSKNILHFGSEQNSLETHDTNKLVYEDGQELPCDLFWPHLYDQDDALPFQGWYSMIEDYTGRNISYRTDTFPALSGLAQQINALSGVNYRAGLWESDLTRGLLWAVTNPQCPVRWKEVSPVHSKTEYTAPSWSWACTPSRVHFLLNNFKNGVDPEALMLGLQPQRRH